MPPRGVPKAHVQDLVGNDEPGLLRAEVRGGVKIDGPRVLLDRGDRNLKVSASHVVFHNLE